MKYIVTAALAATAIACAAVPATASAETYLGVGYSFLDSSDLNLGAITGRAGWKSSTPFGIEGEASFGVKDDTFAGAKVKLNSQWAIYGTATLPVSDTADVFARIGYGSTDLKASSGGFSASGSDESWNFGVGGQVFFDGSNGVRGDYTYADFNDSGHANVWTLSYVHRFK